MEARAKPKPIPKLETIDSRPSVSTSSSSAPSSPVSKPWVPGNKGTRYTSGSSCSNATFGWRPKNAWVFELDPHGRIVQTNERARQEGALFGLTIGKSFVNAVAESDRETFAETLKRTVALNANQATRTKSEEEEEEEGEDEEDGSFFVRIGSGVNGEYSAMKKRGHAKEMLCVMEHQDGNSAGAMVMLLPLPGRNRKNRDLKPRRISTADTQEQTKESGGTDVAKRPGACQVNAYKEMQWKDSVLNQVGEAIIVTDLAGTVSYWNKRATEIFGWKKEEVVGRNIVEITTPEEAHLHAQSIIQNLSEGKTWSGEFTLRRKNGEKFFGRVTDAPVFDDDGKLVGIVGLSSDFTEIRTTREQLVRLTANLEDTVRERTAQLLEANKLLRQEVKRREKAQQQLELLGLVAQKNANGVVICDEHLKIEWVNESFTEQTGWPIQEAWGRAPASFLLEPGQQWGSGLKKLRKKNGAPLTLELDVTEIRNEEGKVVRYVVLSRDVALRLKAEEAIRQRNQEAKANRFKTEFVTTLSHELRTPLNGIIGMSTMMLSSDLSDTAAVQQNLEVILCCSDILLNLINNVIDLRKIESGKMELSNKPFDIQSSVQRAIKACSSTATQKSVNIQFHPEGEVPEWVVGDADRVRQVLVNLISNAVKFTRDQSTITVTVGPAYATCYGCEYDPQGHYFENLSAQSPLQSPSGSCIPADRSQAKASKKEAKRQQAELERKRWEDMQKRIQAEVGRRRKSADESVTCGMVDSVNGKRIMRELDYARRGSSTKDFNMNPLLRSHRRSVDITPPYSPTPASDTTSPQSERRYSTTAETTTTEAVSPRRRAWTVDILPSVPEDGKVHVAVPSKPRASSQPTPANEGETSRQQQQTPMPVEQLWLKFAVSDCGPGISEEEKGMLFKEFTQLANDDQTRTLGSGLGLSICKHLINMMGGHIWLESELGKGTTFYFTVRLSRVPNSQVPALRAALPYKLERQMSSTTLSSSLAKHPLRILIAEDNKFNQQVLVKILEKAGFRGDVVSDGQQAVDQSMKQDYDLVFMDVHMPVMSGLDATRIIVERRKANDAQWPVVCGLTASAMEQDINKCYEAGMDACLSKPVTFDKIRNFLYSVILQKQQQRQLPSTQLAATSISSST